MGVCGPRIPWWSLHAHFDLENMLLKLSFSGLERQRQDPHPNTTHNVILGYRAQLLLLLLLLLLLFSSHCCFLHIKNHPDLSAQFSPHLSVVTLSIYKRPIRSAVAWDPILQKIKMDVWYARGLDSPVSVHYKTGGMERARGRVVSFPSVMALVPMVVQGWRATRVATGGWVFSGSSSCLPHGYLPFQHVEGSAVPLPVFLCAPL